MDSYAVSFLKSHLGELIISIPKSIYFNFRVLPFKSAIKMPFLVSYHVKLCGISKKTFVVKNCNLSTASMRIGFGDSISGAHESPKSIIAVKGTGKIIVGNKLGLSQGCILCAKNATIELGDHFRCNYSTTIEATDSDIRFGNEVVCGWNVTVRNSDGHFIMVNGEEKQSSKPIKVGDHVWLCAHATVLKGVNLGKDCVVAYGSLLSKAFGADGVMYGGVPAVQIRQGVNWKE